MHTVNLSVASVPLSFDVQSIRPEQILTWNGDFHDAVVAGRAIPLNRYLRFEEAVYLPSLLDNIRTEAQRDQVEFGFAQLRLVLCFLRWSNLKEKPPERFESPLILLPVRLVKKKGVRDSFSLEPLSTDAEINPVLRHYFKQLYDVSLPEAIDLTTTSLEAFHEFLASKVQMSEPAVSVVKIDRPRIHLIHAKAQRRLDQYIQRTRLSGRGIRALGDIDYSYDKDNFHPLGLRLFQTRIRRPETNLETIVRDVPRPRTFMMPDAGAVSPVAEQERELYSLGETEESNPYTWKYDLCSVTLGNFHYRKMSLVRDYAALLEEAAENPSFDAIFSLQPRAIDPTPVQPPPLDDCFPVLTCDPTQSSAIAWGRSGRSYIIQGPPGTGKSQTIANLIADYVARGQRVLFVCEKRAAIDVVYHRLQQKRLHTLCALIHDSQEDKKGFIMDLKQTYESVLEHAGKIAPPAEQQRQDLLRAIQHELKPLQHYQHAMCSPAAGSPLPLRLLVGRLVALRECLPDLPPAEKERIPLYFQWCEHRERVERLIAALREMHGETVFAKHPLRRLATRLVKQEHPLATVTSHLQNAERLLGSLAKEFRAAGLELHDGDALQKARQIVCYAEQVRCLAEKNLMSLLRKDSTGAKTFAKLAKAHQARAKELQAARLATTNWRHKLPSRDLPAALEQARTFEKSILSFLRPGWWRLRGVLRRCYDFRTHEIQPAWTQILEPLAREYQAEEAMSALQAKAHRIFKFNGSVEDFVRKVHELLTVCEQLPVEIKELQSRLFTSDSASSSWLRVAEAKKTFDQLVGEIQGFLEHCDSMTFAELREEWLF